MTHQQRLPETYGKGGSRKRWRSARIAKMVCVGLLSLPVSLLVYQNAAVASEENGRRVALVIGNQDYRYVEPLNNPVNDTLEISKILREADFDVTVGTDLSKRGLEQVVRKFLRELQDGDTALFYYSGHALQVGEANFLLPVDAKLSSRYDLEFESLKVSHLLDYMKAASSLQIVMLDACRDNPFEIGSLFWGEEEYSLGKTRGLRRIPNKLGSFISYATRPGQVAYDGEGLMSPFTASVVNNALNPALEIKDLMTRVRDEVVRKTGGQQVPYEDSTLVTSFYFVPPKPDPVVEAHHRVSLPAGGRPWPLSIPEPVQPEGGALSVTITLAPENGTLQRADGSAVAEGVTLAPSELAALTYVTDGEAAGSVELLGYQVEDEWGGKASAIASITVTDAAEAGQPVTKEADAHEDAGKMIEWLAARSQQVVEAAIGVGEIPVYPDAPEGEADGETLWLKLASIDSELQMAVDGRTLRPGDRFPIEALEDLTVRPQIDSETESRRFTLELPPIAGNSSTTITQLIQPMVTQCDQLATQPFDLQAVTEGKLANALDPTEIETACAAAMETYPEVGRFVFQRGRGAFASGDLETASAYFDQAYQMGHVRAGQVLGRMYFLGAGIDRDREKAVELYKKAAERGDAYALHSLGMAEIKGDGTAVNEKAGLEKLLQSVEAGHTFSYNAIGGFYLRGQHVGEDVDRAVYYYNRSAARQDIYGYLNMGTLFRDGTGVPQDFEAAFGWFKKAHDGGHPAAGTAIGLLYFNGQGVEKSEGEATRWFRESAQRGDAWGAFNTAFMLGKQSGTAAARDRVRMLAMAAAVDPSSPAAGKAVDALGKADRRLKGAVLQQSLSDLGFDPGPIDGQPGRKTRAALSRFFESTGKTPVTGEDALIAVVKHQWEQDRPRYDLF